jgi:hypothetical protein
MGGTIIKYDNGDVYDGDLKDNMMNGKGKMTYVSGDIYTGEFKDNMMNGKGIYKYKDGRVFVGNFKDDKKEGPGRMIDSFGRALHAGHWKDGKLDTLGDTLMDERLNRWSMSRENKKERPGVTLDDIRMNRALLMDDRLKKWSMTQENTNYVPIGPDENYVETKKNNNRTDTIMRRQAQETRRREAERHVNDGYLSSEEAKLAKQARYSRHYKTLKRSPNNTGYDGDVG